MQSIADTFPSSDTLEKITGVEDQLRKRRRIGGFGWALLILGSTVQIAAKINNLGVLSIDELWERSPWLATGLVVATLSIVLALLLITWSTYWLKASKRPFRYTCSVGAFEPVPKPKGGAAPKIADTMSWLSQDLQRFLNERVQRFDFLEPSSASGGKTSSSQSDDERVSGHDAHIHIHGNYIVRSSSDCRNCVEVAARIRIGPAGSPEVLAPTPPPVNVDANPEKSRGTYDDLLERVYHSVVSEVYRRLQEDVERKINLLPTRKLRVIALLHEADDYAQSNTLHAYDQAADLYGRAAQALEASLRPLPEGRLRRFMLELRGRVSSIRRGFRRFESRYRPRAAEIDVLFSRALIGYALMQNIRLNLKGLVGARSLIGRFEPVRYIDLAHECLLSLSDDVPGRKDAFFRCLTVTAVAYNMVGDRKQATKALEAARSMDPKRATEDQIYLFASARISLENRTRISTLRHAVDLDPRFELAQFDLAYETEMLWRSRETFEAFGADMVLEEYKNVTNINPGNLAGWANSGHVCWLIRHLEDAQKHFEQGIRYREVQKDAYVSELQFGLARIHAEEGRIQEAYKFYVAAVSSMISGGDYSDYFYERMTPATLQRYKQYYKGFTTHIRSATASTEESETPATELQRLTNSVRAFVLYDLGRALYGAGLKFGANQSDLQMAAMRKFRAAARRNPAFALPQYWIGILTRNFQDSRRPLEKAIELEQKWSDAQLALIRVFAEAALKAEGERDAYRQKRDDLEAKEKELETLKQGRAVWRSTLSGAADASRPTSDALVHQYGVSVSRDASKSTSNEPRTSQNPDTSQSYVVSKDVADEISSLEVEIRQLRSEIQADETIRREYSDPAKHYREIAEENLRRLMPHAWLWNGKRFNWSAVSDRRLRKYMVWEREFTNGHAQALFLWALRFLYDKEEHHDKAEMLFKLLRDHFWPADENVLHHLLDIQLPKARDDGARRRLIERATERNPGVVDRLPNLGDYGFSLDQEIKLLGDLREEMPYADAAERIAKLLADALYRKAETGSPEGIRCLQKALSLPQPLDLKAKLHLKMAQLLTPSDDVEVIAEAIEHVTETDRIREYPNSDVPLRSLTADQARFESRAESASVWEEAGTHFLDLKPAIRVRISRDLHAALEHHRTTDGGTNKTLDDLHWGLYWELGVLFPRPAIEVDADIDSDDRYFIDLYGIELVTNSVRKDQRLINASQEKLESLGIASEHAINPANGRECAFVDEQTYRKKKPILDQFGYIWDAFGYVVLHVAAVMRKNAAEFLRVDNAAELLELHSLSDKKAAFEENGQLVELTGVLRAFAAEELPINDLRQLVQIFESERQKPHSGITELAESVRTHPDYRRKNKYVSQPRRLFLPLGPNFTEAMDHGLTQGSGQVLAIEPVIVQNMLAAVRDYLTNMGADEPNPVIVAKPDHRPWVKKLVELEFPHLWVLSEKEAFPEHMHELGPEIEIRF